MILFCYPVYKSLEVSESFSQLQRSRVVRASDLKSRGRILASRSDFLAGIVSQQILVELLCHACSQLLCLMLIGIFKSIILTELIYFVSFGLRGKHLDELANKNGSGSRACKISPERLDTLSEDNGTDKRNKAPCPETITAADKKKKQHSSLRELLHLRKYKLIKGYKIFSQ